MNLRTTVPILTLMALSAAPETPTNFGSLLVPPAKGSAQDPTPVHTSEQLVAQNLALTKENRELQKKLAVAEAARDAAQEEITQLRETQNAFNQLRQFGLPMDHETDLRHPVEKRLERQAEVLKIAASPEDLRAFRTTISKIFSKETIARDRTSLQKFLSASGATELTAEEINQFGVEFEQAMDRWATFLGREEQIRRFVAHRGEYAAVIAFPPAAQLFLESPLPNEVTLLASVSREYVACKALFLAKILTNLMGTNK